MIQIKGLNTFMAKTAAQKAMVKQKAAEFVRAKARAVLLDALKHSPQYSGDFTYNWHIETGTSGSAGYSKWFKKDFTGRGDLYPPVGAGHQDAIKSALSDNNNLEISNLKYNSKIRLVNHAPEAAGISSGDFVTRKENAINGSIGAPGVVGYLKVKYKFLE